MTPKRRYREKLEFISKIIKKEIKNCQKNSEIALHKITTLTCTSGRAFRNGFGPRVDKNFGLNSGLRRTFVLGAQKYNQNNLAILLNFSHLT